MIYQIESSLVRNLKNIYFTLCMIYITGATFLTEIDWLIVPVAILGFICFSLKNLKWDPFISFFLLIFTLINIFSYTINGDEDFTIRSFIGYYFRILIPYFLIKIFNHSFFEKFEKFIYYGALISLPCFLILIFDPFFYNNYLSEFNMSGELRTQVGYWNCFFYTSHGGYENIRNDGFAIEPAHFGYLIGIALFHNLTVNNFKYNKRLIILTIAGLTTLSTTFYISLLFFFLFFLINKNISYSLKFFMFSTFLILGFYIINSSVISEKFEKTNNSNDKVMKYGIDKIKKGNSLNRFGAFEIESKNILSYPFGHGVNNTGKIHAIDGEVIAGPNGLMALISFWGLTGFLFLFYTLKKYAEYLKYLYPYLKGYYLLPIIILVYLFSNSISRDILLWSILFFPLINMKNFHFNNK